MGRHSFRTHWHDRRLELADGDVLTWVVMDEPAPPRLECFRLASTGAIHQDRAMALLQAAGHPDAALRLPTMEPLPGLTH